jgi:hypothetical protein
MKRILIYRHPNCERCARIARLHHAVDWFDRIADSTATPPTGALRMGEIVVEDLGSHRIFRGAEALALVYRQAIAYWPLLLLLWIPPLRAWLDREVRGGADGSCQLAPARDNTRSSPVSHG